MYKYFVSTNFFNFRNYNNETNLKTTETVISWIFYFPNNFPHFFKKLLGELH